MAMTNKKHINQIKVSRYMSINKYEFWSIEICNILTGNEVFVDKSDIETLIQALQQVQKMKESGEWLIAKLFKLQMALM